MRIAGFIIGDAKRKAIEVEKGAFDLTKPTNNGIVEQEQNGVTPPRRAPQHADKFIVSRKRENFALRIDEKLTDSD